MSEERKLNAPSNGRIEFQIQIETQRSVVCNLELAACCVQSLQDSLIASALSCLDEPYKQQQQQRRRRQQHHQQHKPEAKVSGAISSCGSESSANANSSASAASSNSGNTNKNEPLREPREERTMRWLLPG